MPYLEYPGRGNWGYSGFGIKWVDPSKAVHKLLHKSIDITRLNFYAFLQGKKPFQIQIIYCGICATFSNLPSQFDFFKNFRIVILAL